MADFEMEATQEALQGLEAEIDRDEAIRRYFTPREEVAEDEFIVESCVVLEDFELAVLRPTTARPLEQLRRSYKPSRIEMIGLDIHEKGQNQNCNVNVVGEECIDKYLADAARFFGREVLRDELVYSDTFGGFVVSLSGHNRQFGIAHENNLRYGHPDAGRSMLAQVFRNQTFAQALAIQATENSGESPPIWERAKQMFWYQQLNAEDGTPVTPTEIGKIWNVDHDTVNRDLRFAQLPEGIRDLVEQGFIKPSTAFHFDRLMQGDDPLMAVQDVVEFAKQVAAEDWSGRKVEETISQMLLFRDIPAEVRVLMNDELSRQQRKEVAAMYRNGASVADVKEMAVWILTERPSIGEVKKQCTSYVRTTRTGQLSMTSQEGFLPGLNEENSARLGRLSTSVKVSKASRDVLVRALGLKEILVKGMIDEGVEERPIAEAVREVLSPLLQAEAGVERPETVELLEQLTSLRGFVETSGNGQREEFAEAIAVLESAIRDEAATNPQAQIQRLARAVEVERQKDPHVVQEDLFHSA